MKKQIVFLAISGMMFFSSCLTSLHPLYTAGTEVFQPSMLGLWQEGDEAFYFEKAPDGDFYKLTYRKSGEPEEMVEAHLLKLGSHHYLDFKRWKDDNIWDYNVLSPSIDAHNFARVIWDEKQFKLILFDGEKIEELLKQRRARIKHERLENDTFVLTAGPEELQQFVLKYGEELLDFSEPLILYKSTD